MENLENHEKEKKMKKEIEKTIENLMTKTYERQQELNLDYRNYISKNPKEETAYYNSPDYIGCSYQYVDGLFDATYELLLQIREYLRCGDIDDLERSIDSLCKIHRIK